MNDRKNFSALGKIDEKYVEEADAYAAPAREKEGTDRKGGRRKRLRRLVFRWSGIAAGLAAVSLACWYAATFFSGAPEKSGTASSFVDDSYPEAQDSMNGAWGTASPDSELEGSSSSEGDCPESGSESCSESSSPADEKQTSLP